MKKKLHLIAAVVLACIVAVACLASAGCTMLGGEESDPIDDPNDPVMGVWTYAKTLNGQTTTLTVTFAADGAGTWIQEGIRGDYTTYPLTWEQSSANRYTVKSSSKGKGSTVDTFTIDDGKLVWVGQGIAFTKSA